MPHKLAIFLVSFCSAAVARGDFISIENPSFEDISGESVFNEFTFGPLNGWELYDPDMITNGGAGNDFFIGTLMPTAPVYFTSGAPDGQRVGIAYNTNASRNQGEYGFQQTTGATLQPFTRYRLTVEVGNIASGASLNGVFFDLDGFPGYRVELLAGGFVVAQDNNSLSIAEGQFETSVIEFTSDSLQGLPPQSLVIRLINLNLVDASFPTADLEVDFDNVRLESFAVVPEPSSLALVALGMVLCHVRAHRNRRFRS